MKNSFTSEDTSVAKGVAIILMVIHHLFAFPDRIPATAYLSVLEFLPVEQSPELFIGKFGKVCVAAFLFLSGFGMCKSLTAKPRNTIIYAFEKCLAFFRTYWICFVIFVPIGLVFFPNQPQYHFDLDELIFNFLGWDNSFNEEWWFVKTYLMLLCLLPLILFILHKSPFLLLFVSMVAFYLSGFSFARLDGNPFLWQLPFTLGILFAYFDIFERSPVFFDKSLPFLKAVGIYIIVLLLRKKLGSSVRADAFYAPFLVYYSSAFIAHEKVKQVVSLFGKYAFQIWLTHTFFCYYFFQDLILLPRLSVLIAIWLLLISLATAFVIAWLEKLLMKLLIRKKLSVTADMP